MRFRRPPEGRIDRRTADILRGIVLYCTTAIIAGLLGWVIVVVSAAT